MQRIYIYIYILLYRCWREFGPLSVSGRRREPRGHKSGDGDRRDGPERGDAGRAKLPLKHDARISSQTASFQRGNELGSPC